ncbi:MAG: AtpZ/AtpI family protein [Deltaproteobacteria bacterium]|nr:AtpZ/AtpI family protein [Deltaproteobacteria bacterium]
MPRDDSREWMRTYGLLSGAALQLVGAVVGMAMLGWWLDEQWQTAPLLTVLCAISGAVGGFWNLWRILQWKEEREKNRE